MISKSRQRQLERDRPYLRHKREQRREVQAEKEWQALQKLHARRERRAYEARLKLVPAVVSAVVTALVTAEQEAQAKQRQWAMFHTLWSLNKARGDK